MRQFTLGKDTDDERTYNVLSFFEGEEDSINGHEMVRRVKKLGAHLGKDHLGYILEHKDEIPPELRGIYFIFTDECSLGDPMGVACVEWYGEYSWCCYWFRLDAFGFARGRVLRPL